MKPLVTVHGYAEEIKGGWRHLLCPLIFLGGFIMKTRRSISFVMSLCLLGSVFSASCVSAYAADEVTEAETISTETEISFQYDRKEGPLYFSGNDVVKCDPEYSGEVIIPPLQDENNIGHILEDAFDRCYNVTSVVIPDGYIVDENAYGTIARGDIKQFYQEGPFYFRCDLEHAVLVRCAVDYSGDVEIPAFVQGLPVTFVSGLAFNGCEDITSVTVPSGVSVGPNAFTGMVRLEKLIFEGSSYSFLGLDYVMGNTILDDLIIDSHYFVPLKFDEYNVPVNCTDHLSCRVGIHRCSRADELLNDSDSGFKLGYTELYYLEDEAENFEAGDVNMDSKVSIADSVAIMNYITNSEKHGLTEVQQKLADVVGSGDGITAVDALEIQRRGTEASL